MANESDDLNLAKGQVTETKESGGMKKVIIIVVAVVLLLAGAGGAYFMFGGSAEPQQSADGETVEAESEPETDPIYFPLSPAFVVNSEQGGRTRYLQVELQVMSYDQAVIDKVESSMPAVRNSLIMLFSDQDYALLSTVEGKENLRQQVLEAVNKVIPMKDGSRVDDVFFTAFVTQ